MQLPLGMLIYSAHRRSEAEAYIMGMWYYKEVYVPSSDTEKRESANDFKSKRCIFISVAGTFPQICDLISQTDKFQSGSDVAINSFVQLTEKISLSERSLLFDEVNDLKGTSLSLDTLVDIEETLEEVQAQINSVKKAIVVRVAKDWSWAGDLRKAIGN